MKFYLEWIFLFIIAEAVLSVLQFALRKKCAKNAPHFAFAAIKIVLATAFAGLVMAGPVILRPVQPFLVALYAALFADGVADLIYTIICAIKKCERKFAVQKILGLVFGIAFFIFGTVNMQTVVPKYHTYTSDLLKSEHKFVFISDMHVGSAQPMSVTEKTISDIKAQNPDFIILGGDIVDDYTTKSEMEETFRLFGQTGIPVYYIYGNHEVVQHPEYMKNGIEYTEKDLVQAMEKNGIKILADSYADIAPDLVLLGRQDDASVLRKDEAFEKKPPEKFLLVADHQPLGTEADLIVSGHTHAGQFFPLKALYAVIGKVEGDYHIGDIPMYVSSGASGWRVPFRTDSRSAFEVITLKPES